MRASRGAGAGREQGPGPTFRPIDIVFSCAMGALLLILIVQYSKSSAAEAKAVRASRSARELSQRLDDISKTLEDMSRDLSDARLARADTSALTRRLDALESRPSPAEISPADLSSAVDAALERRREAFGGNMEQRGEEIVAAIAERIDLDGVRTSLRKTAENFREGGEGERTEGEKKADETVAKGFDAMAEGIDLFRKMQAGDITREEFREKSRELREKARKQFENMTPEDREALGKRFGGFGRRRNRDRDRDQDGGGEGGKEGGDEKF